MTTFNHLKQRRVFVLGLDGATLDLIQPWMDAGHLPNLKKLMEAGAHGELESTYPPLTAPAWASFMTGKSPANHGLLEFFRRESGSYRLQLNSRTDIDGRTLWRVLSDAGVQVGVVGLPLTWPPETVNGFLVTGLLTPREEDVTFTHPPELGDELDDVLGGYILQHTEKYLQDDPMRLAEEEFAILENKFDAAIYLLDNKPWQFFMLHILGTDVLQHGYWHWMDPNHVQHREEGGKLYGDVIRRYYERVDARLPEILERLPANTNIFVMSDHGFGPLKKYINFNTWLLKRGFLKLKRNPWSLLRYLAFRLGYNYRLAWEIGSRVGLVRWIINLGRGTQDKLQRSVFLSMADIDWSRTSAYSVGNFGQIYLNLEGREPEGSVSPGAEAEKVLAELEEALRELRDPETGAAVIGPIWRGEELWQGKYSELAPDLFFFTKDYQYKAMGLSDFGSNQVFEDLYGTRAHHHMNGVFMVSGPGIKRDYRIEGARLYDLMPNILHLMGVPVPLGLDGQILNEIYDGDLADRAVEYESPRSQDEDRDRGGYTREEEEALTEMLRNLGYVS